MDEKLLKELKAREDSARRFSNLFSWSGVIAIPPLCAGVLMGNKILAIGSLCWFVSHFVGYLTRMIHDEHKDSVTKLYYAEKNLKTQEDSAVFRNTMTLN